MFATPTSPAPLTQGDLFDDCPLVGLNVGTAPVDLTNTTVKSWVARVIVLTQACDLTQAKADRWRQTDCEPGVAVSRTPGSAFRCDLHAGRATRALRN
jgi:hypothetical protein